MPHQAAGPTPPLLTWKVAQKKLPWGIVLLLGGGFALAKGSEVSDSETHNVNMKLGWELAHNMVRLIMSPKGEVWCWLHGWLCKNIFMTSNLPLL